MVRVRPAGAKTADEGVPIRRRQGRADWTPVDSQRAGQAANSPLGLLLSTGPMGFTSGEASPLGWARRTSHYVFKLRRAGIPITTTWETTADGARVARYCLAAPVEVVAEGRGE